MHEIVINAGFGGFGGFGLSDKARSLYRERTGRNIYDWDAFRDDPVLVSIVKELGVNEAGDDVASLKIVEIPDNVEWQIEECAGKEWIAEKHRTWR